MFSFVKALDMYHETISFTFYGDNKEIKNYLLKNYFDRAIFIYNTENKSDSGVVICKNQTCSKDRKSTRLNSSHSQQSRMPSSA